MTLTRKLASVVCLALLYLNYSVSNAQNVGVVDPTQVYTTGNIVQPTIAGSNTTPWINGIYQDNLTCWGWGDPGNCGPNPTVRPGGLINFSFGTTNLYQMQAIASVLPDSGSGLRVNGFNFGFTAKNGNGWDDSRQDYLSAYVSFYGVNGDLAQSYDYGQYTNRRYNWTTFNFSENFTTPYASKDLGAVQYGFVGRDNNGWAGPYGPEIYNVNFSLKYSVDVCAIDATSSPTCPGFAAAMAKLIPPVSTPEIISATTSAPIAPTAPTVIEAPVTASATPTPVASTSVSSSAPVISAAPTATNPQPKVGEVATAGGSKPSVSMSTIMSAINAESSRLGNVERSVVQQAVQEATAAAQQAVQAGEATAASLTATSISGSMASTSSSGTGITVRSTGTSLSMNIPQNTSVVSIGALRPDQFFKNTDSFKTDSASTGDQSFNSSMMQQPQRYVDQPMIKVEEAKATDTLVNNLLENKPMIVMQQNEAQQGSSVNQKVKDNEAAGTTTIAMIARVPAGYELYSVGIKDASFYAPKEIYKNQTVIDNARALRQMGSDRLHQQMIDSQYKE